MSALTLGDLRAGDGPAGRACVETDPLWEAIGLDPSTPVDVLRERWTPLAAVMLARTDV